MTERARACEPRECTFLGKHHVKLRMEIWGKAIVFNMTEVHYPVVRRSIRMLPFFFTREGFCPKILRGSTQYVARLFTTGTEKI